MSEAPARTLPQRQLHDYSHRFGDWTSMEYLCKFGKDGSSQSQTLYSGENVSIRMTAVREAIVYVRENWKDYSLLMDDLRSYIQELTDTFPEKRDETKHIHTVLSSFKIWNDVTSPTEDENFSVIRLYTSKAGYDQIFRIINQAFRMEDLVLQEKRLRCAVFLIELLNIDLFNYTLRSSRASNFQGTVYRGVSFSEDQLQAFKNLAARPVSERYWAIPLAMMSASTSQDVALKEFASTTTMDTTSTRYPFLWRIHVVELSPKYLQTYRDKFPSSVVSTICAVPIQELSDYDTENEVLLRGPFFQLVCMREEELDGRSIHVMDLVTLNTNRDHPSTTELGERGEKARQLFACLVGMWRTEVCKKLAELYGLADDVNQYEQLFQAERAKFEDYING